MGVGWVGVLVGIWGTNKKNIYVKVGEGLGVVGEGVGTNNKIFICQNNNC